MDKLLKISFCCLLVLFATSCTDLESDLPGDYTEDFSPNNPGGNQSVNVNGAIPNDGLNAAFGALFGSSAGHGSYFSIQEISSDEAVITQKGGDWFDGGIWLRMHRHTWEPTNPGINGAWTNSYDGIAECNRLLDGGSLDPNGTAQVRTVRAYYYWRLLDLFGNVKIPTTAGANPSQSTRVQLFNFVESELLAARGDLKAAYQGYGRVSQGGANALLARLYLNAEVYTGTARNQDAIDAADAVINLGVYDLHGNYAEVFAPENVENIEHIWVVPFDEATGGGMFLAQMTFHYPTQLTYKLAAQPWNGYSTLEAFYNSYDSGDARQASNHIAGPQFDVSGNPILDVAFDPADPDGPEINYTPAINELAPSGSRQAGARFGKFSHKIGQQPNMDNDYPLFRYAGVLLDKAEALFRKNGYSDAMGLMLVNQVRARAGLSSPLSAMTADGMLAERGKELFIESTRRTDLIRFGKWGSAWWEKSAHSDAYKVLFPIPQPQIDAANGSLNQNPGY